jgi:hypothetical protein
VLADFITHLASDTGLSQKQAKAALGIILNAADRQGTPFVNEIFERIPGARTLAADAGAANGASTGVIARLIEQTPGGKRFVTSEGGIGQQRDWRAVSSNRRVCFCRVWHCRCRPSWRHLRPVQRGPV